MSFSTIFMACIALRKGEDQPFSATVGVLDAVPPMIEDAAPDIGLLRIMSIGFVRQRTADTKRVTALIEYFGRNSAARRCPCRDGNSVAPRRRHPGRDWPLRSRQPTRMLPHRRAGQKTTALYARRAGTVCAPKSFTSSATERVRSLRIAVPEQRATPSKPLARHQAVPQRCQVGPRQPSESRTRLRWLSQ
jgi:hypothetical protein